MVNHATIDMEGFDAGSIGQNYPDDFRIDIKGILSKVNLTDPPIIGLIVFHVLMLITTIALRKNKLWRTVIFGISMAVALSAEKVGTFVSEDWRRFGFTDNYFDEYGVFLLFFVALPPLINCILLFSVLAGDLGGRLVDRYLANRRQQKPTKEEETKPKQD